MSTRDASALARTVGDVARRHPGLRLLVLHGSRAREDARADSDWDFAYLGEALDVDALLADLVTALGTERLDLVDLARAGGLLRYRVARDGVPLVAVPPAAFDRFWLAAVTFWCDAQPVLTAGYADLLAGLGDG